MLSVFYKITKKEHVSKVCVIAPPTAACYSATPASNLRGGEPTNVAASPPSDDDIWRWKNNEGRISGDDEECTGFLKIVLDMTGLHL